MIVYKAMSSKELLELINRNETISYISQENAEYIHFFKYPGHALHFMKQRNYPVIAKIYVPDDAVIKEEYGLYNDIDTNYDDSLMGFYLPLPEYIVNKKLLNPENIIEFSNNGTWKNNFQFDTNHQNDFWVEKKISLTESEKQKWDIESIYYEYIKVLLSKFDYDVNQITEFLKKINLDEELENIASQIKKEKIMTKRKYPKYNY